jgi:hypothetical protein
MAANAEYKVLLCVSLKSRNAVSLAGIVKYLRKIHIGKPQVRRQVQDFAVRIPWEYEYLTDRLLVDGLAQQPVVPVVDGFPCPNCPFKSGTRKGMKLHGTRRIP